MRLTLNSIIYYLKDFHPITLIKKEDLSIEFDGIKQYYEPNPDLKQNHLYVAKASFLMQLGEKTDKNLTYLCINDSEERNEDLYQMANRLILISKEFMVEQILNKALEIFEDFRNWDKNMHIAALQGGNLPELFAISAELIKLPMIIFDASFNVLAYTKHIQSDYKFYNTTIANGYTPSEIILKLKKEHIFEALNKNDGVLVYSSAGSQERNNVYVKLKAEGTLLGYGCVFGARKDMEQGYIDIMKCFFDNLKLYFIQNYKNSRYGDFMYDNFLTTLMQNPNMEEEQLTAQLEYMDGITIQGLFHLIMFRFTRQQEVPLSFIARELKHICNHGYPFLFNGRIYLLLQQRESKTSSLFQKLEKERIHSILYNYGYQCYVSKSFHHIREIFLANIQCEKTSELLADNEKKEDGYYYFNDYQFQHLLRVWSENLPLSLLLKEEYITLKTYCKKNKKDYLTIIKTYLENQNNATKTSEILYLHRNTVIYTIKKIEELLLVDFNDYQIAQAFMLSFLADT